MKSSAAAPPSAFPVGDMFGIQADLTATRCLRRDNSGRGGAMPSRAIPIPTSSASTAAMLTPDSANVWYIGPEAELYLGNVSIEAVGGYMDISNGGGSEFYAVGDLALYATDNLRLSVGCQHGCQF